MARPIPWDVQKAIELYQSGQSLNAIARVLGVRFQAVHSALVKRGVKMRSRANCGPANGKWTGGRNVDKHGYILVHLPNHPMATKAGYVREHRLVAEKALGRYLTPTEVVHHKDDDLANNDPSNLVVYETNGQHLAETLAGKVPKWTEDGKRRIREGTIAARKREAIRRQSRRDDGQSKQKTRRSKAKPDKGSGGPSKKAS